MMNLPKHLRALLGEHLALNAVKSSARHLRFLDDLAGAPNKGLAAYFPETAAGKMKPSPRESVYYADGIGYIGHNDGSMVPILAENLEPMPENIWDARKFSALVEAVEARENQVLQPGYADLSLEGGELAAQVRDGNHRTFAPVEAGGDMSWVMMSDRTRQELETDNKLYKAIRAAQRQAGVPLYTRKRASKVKAGKLEELLAAEHQYAELEQRRDKHNRDMLSTYGFVEGGYSHTDQLRRPETFWRTRLAQLPEDAREDYFDRVSVEHERDEKTRMELFMRLLDLRREAGLKHGERLDPVTGKVTK